VIISVYGAHRGKNLSENLNAIIGKEENVIIGRDFNIRIGELGRVNTEEGGINRLVGRRYSKSKSVGNGDRNFINYRKGMSDPE